MNSDIELGSEKVRHIFGKAPSATVRYVNYVVIVVLAVLAMTSLILPYRRGIEMDIYFNPEESRKTGIAYVKDKGMLHSNMNVNILVNDVVVCGTIDDVEDRRRNGYHRLLIKLNEDDEITIPMKCKGLVVGASQSIFDMVFCN